jgi:hypothetical protein
MVGTEQPGLPNSPRVLKRIGSREDRPVCLAEWYITETVIYHQSKLIQQEPSGSASRRRATAAPPDRMTNPSI